MFKKLMIVLGLSVLSLQGMGNNEQQGSIIEAQAVAQEINPTEQTLLTAIHQTLCAIKNQSDNIDRLERNQQILVDRVDALILQGRAQGKKIQKLETELDDVSRIARGY